jgi:hypothetical protein
MTTSAVPRLQPLEPPYEPEMQRTLERMMGGMEIEPLKLFRVVAHNQRFLDKFRSTGTTSSTSAPSIQSNARS